MTTDTDRTSEPTDADARPATRWWRRPQGRFAALAVVGLLVIGLPAAAQVAGFRDVGGSYVHADNIARLKTAGVTNGCGDGSRYCPNDPVTRGAMASFLARGGSQAAADASVTTLAAGSGNVNGVPVSVDVTGSGESGGRQNVLLQGAVTVSVDTAVADCPCEVEAFVFRARDEAQGQSSFAVLPGELASNGQASVSLPVAWATELVSGRRDEFRVAVFVEGTTAGGLEAQGSLNAVTAPFGEVPTR